MNKRMTQLFALMAASLVWNISAASPAQLPQYMAPAYAPASSFNGIASFRPNYRFHPQSARQSGRSYQSYPERSARSWPFPVSYQPIVTPWQDSHYYQALAGGYQPYQPAMPMPWMASRGPWVGQRPVPAYPTMPMQPMQPMGHGPLAGLPWGNAPVALSYPPYYRAATPRAVQHPFQRPDRRYIRGQFAANNPRFRPAPPSLGYAPVASNYPAYNRAAAPRAVQNPFQRPDRRYIRGQFAANNARFRPAPPSLGYVPVASNYPAYNRAAAPRAAQNPFQRPDRRYIRGQFAANNPRFRPAPSLGYPPVASNYPAYNRAPAPRAAQNPFQRPDRRYISGQFAAANPRFIQVPSPQRHVAASYNDPRRMGYRFRPDAPVYPVPLNSAPVAVTQWQSRTPYATNPVVQWQKRVPYGIPAYQFRPDPRLAQAPRGLLPGASKDGRQPAFPGYGQSFRQVERGVADGLVWRPLRGDALAGDLQHEDASYQ